MNAGAIDLAGAWRVATIWIDKELHRWGVCLLIVVAIHAGLIAGFEAWKAVDHNDPPSGTMMIDLGPLPGPGGHGTTDKLANKSQDAVAKPLVQTESRKREHFHRLVKLRARIEHLLKPQPKVPEHLPPPSAAAWPRPQSTQVASASAVPALGPGNSQTQNGTGQTAVPSGGCCGGREGGGPLSFGQGDAATWQGLLLADLEAHKRYPPSAQESGEEGVVYLRFAMDRSGKVLSFSLAKSSGFDDLDQETLDLIQRSQPLPPPPSTVTGNVIELVVPVQFQLRQTNEE